MATITIPDELQRIAEEHARRAGESVNALVERLLRNLIVHTSYPSTSPSDTASSQAKQQAIARLIAIPPTTTLPPDIDYQAVAEAEALAEKLRAKYNLRPLPPEIQALQGILHLPPDADYKHVVADILWERYNSLEAD